MAYTLEPYQHPMADAVESWLRDGLAVLGTLSFKVPADSIGDLRLGDVVNVTTGWSSGQYVVTSEPVHLLVR